MRFFEKAYAANIFTATPAITPCSSVSIVNFEHVIAGWVHMTIIAYKMHINPFQCSMFYF